MSCFAFFITPYSCLISNLKINPKWAGEKFGERVFVQANNRRQFGNCVIER